MKKHRWIWLIIGALLLICLIIIVMNFLLMPSRSVCELAKLIHDDDRTDCIWLTDGCSGIHAVDPQMNSDIIDLLNNLEIFYQVGERTFFEAEDMLVLENMEEHDVQYFLFSDNFTVVWVADNSWVGNDNEISQYEEIYTAYRVKNPWEIRKMFREICEADSN